VRTWHRRKYAWVQCMMGAKQCVCSRCVHVDVCHRQQRQWSGWQYITSKGCAKPTSVLYVPYPVCPLHATTVCFTLTMHKTHKPSLYPLLCVFLTYSIHRTHNCAIPAAWPPCAVSGQGAAWAPASHAPQLWLALASALCEAHAGQSQCDCSPHWMQLQRMHETEHLMLHSRLRFLRSRC